MSPGGFNIRGAVVFEGPPDDPRHPVNVVGRMHQRYACAGWPIWMARRDRPRIDLWADLQVFDGAYHAVGLNLTAALATLSQGQAEGQKGPGWRAGMALCARNMRVLRRMTRRAMQHHELKGWDGPRFAPARWDAPLILDAVKAWEAQHRR